MMKRETTLSPNPDSPPTFERLGGFLHRRHIPISRLVASLVIAWLTTGCGTNSPETQPAPELSSSDAPSAAATASPPTAQEEATSLSTATPGEAEDSARRIAITIDDLTAAPGSMHNTEQQEQITEQLLAVLAEYKAPAVGFVNESKLVQNGEVQDRRVRLLERWLEAGHELGNHGFRHLDLHQVEPEVWLNDVRRGDRITRPLVEGRGGPLRWFRHPFLRTGLSVEVQRQTESALADMGYTIAPVTIDNGEWIYGGAYARPWMAGDTEGTERLGKDYVRYMLSMVEYYEEQSRKIQGELIPQVLLLHAYALNADWLAPLLGELEERGYQWITLEEALRHPAYQQSGEGYTGQGGITWLHRWAITRRMDPKTYAGEPRVPDWVQELL